MILKQDGQDYQDEQDEEAKVRRTFMSIELPQQHGEKVQRTLIALAASLLCSL